MDAADAAPATRVPRVLGMRYDERQGIPLRAAAAVVVGWGSVVAVLFWLAGGTDLFGIVFGACLFALPAAYTIWTNGRRRIRIDDEFLRVGRREPVPLDAIRGFGVLEGRPLRRLRSQLFWPAPSGRAAAGMAAAAAVGAWGSLAALSSLSGRLSRYGLACPFWFRQGVVVHAPFRPAHRSTWTPSEMPALWLIGTHSPDALVEALRTECEARRVALAEAPGDEPA